MGLSLTVSATFDAVDNTDVMDVVKKPKLDNHGARCHASFTCIDCSKTFAGPAQWKSHTSCMSEEQKYHKSVYQEPRGRGRGRGQRGRGGARGGSTRASYSGSGENSIPLGPQTNAWTAPPPDPVNNAPFDSTEWTATTEPAAEPAPASQTDAPEPDSGKSKKSKKRKTEDVEMTEPASAPDEPAKKKKKKDSPAAQPEPTTNKKEKKKKSRELETTNQDGDVTMTDVAADIAVNGKSKKSRKSETLANGEPAAVASPNSTPDESSTAPIDDPPRKKKSRKSKADETVTGESSALVNTEPATNPEPIMNGHSVDKKQKKDKKSKTEKSNGVSILPVSDELPSAPNANDLIPMPTIESEAHLSKKDRQKKAKKEKKEQAKAEAKAREAELLALEPPAPQNDALANGEAVLEPNKSKRGKEGKAQVVEIVEETGASQDAPKEKKKKSKREKREEAAAA